MGTWLPAISITKAPLDVIQIGSHLIRHATSAQATELGLFLISLRMSLSCLQHHRLRHCFLLRSYGPNAQLCLYVSCFLKGFLKVLPLITWIILFANRPRHCKPSIALRRWFEERSDSTAAAIKWVLKDGIGLLLTFWKMLLGLEMLTPAFPHPFVFIGATAGAGRFAATLI
ncbi:hypothetical protein D5086_006184 [Populus alba]|uniref:Uncharacterized protein n=1 Tax=Populus alba TaxID=43335 RepID=A0ACC4CL97_POPAL